MNRARAIWTPIWTPIWNWCLQLFGRLRGLEPDGHPTPELLAAYHEDRLPPEKDGKIQEHFVECPECPELVLGLDEFVSKEMPVMSTDDLSETRVDWAWRRLRHQLLREITVPRIPRPRLLWLQRPALAWGMVGVLLPGTVGLGLRVQDLASALRVQQAPQLNPPVAMVPLPAATRSANAVTTRMEFKVPPGPRFLLMLDPPDKAELPEYRLEIRTPLGEGVWAAGGLTLNEDRRFVIGLSQGFLPPGEYDIYVLGGDRGQESVIQDYQVRFSYL